MKSPTILHLADPDWLSLHAVIPESQLWERIERLKADIKDIEDKIKILDEKL